MKATSGEEPVRIITCGGKSHYNYNITEVDGVYEYDYVEIQDKVTKAKIIRALEDSKLNIVEGFDPDELESTYIAAKETLKLSDIANLTYAQLNTYINNHVTDLASAKAYLKTLSKVVLALLKYLNV